MTVSAQHIRQKFHRLVYEMKRQKADGKVPEYDVDFMQDMEPIVLVREKVDGEINVDIQAIQKTIN